WRLSVTIVALVCLLAIIPVVLVIRNYPQDIGILPFGARTPEMAPPVPAPPIGNPFVGGLSTLGRWMGHRDFGLLCGSSFICGATTNGLIGTHLIPASMEHGIPEVTAASFLAVIGVFDVAGTTISGWLSDRFNSRVLLAWYYTLRGLALLFLPY